MDRQQFLNDILKIHSVSVATVDESSKPANRIIDMMYMEDDCLYFLTGRGKNFYKELKENGYVALSCQKNNRAYTLKGYVEEVDHHYLDILFDHNRYMWGTYPGETRHVLEVFRIYKWRGEFFDLTSKPVNRIAFAKDMDDIIPGTFYVDEGCIGCKKCIDVCPQKCITFKNNKAFIPIEHCLRCGACYEVCPANAIRQY
mgnify:CR=1 FL=1